MPTIVSTSAAESQPHSLAGLVLVRTDEAVAAGGFPEPAAEAPPSAAAAVRAPSRLQAPSTTRATTGHTRAIKGRMINPPS